MLVGEIIRTILSNFIIVLLAIAIVTSVVKIRRAKMSRRPFSSSYIIWGELLFYLYGVANIYGGFFHAYAGDMAAASIGWANSPFQYELGWFEMGYGAVALFALWRGREFRLALTVPYSIFLLAAAAQHVQMMVADRNYAPNNAGLLLWVGDIAVPLVVLALAWLSRDE